MKSAAYLRARREFARLLRSGRAASRKQPAGNFGSYAARNDFIRRNALLDLIIEDEKAGALPARQ